MKGNNALAEIGERQIWSASFGDSPVVGTAIHDGHMVRNDLIGLMVLSEQERLYEEDPFTAQMIGSLTNRIIGHRSRFEIDLNRARDAAIYLEPEQSWGLKAWHNRPDDVALKSSLLTHDDYYAMLQTYLRRIEQRHGRFVVLDIHSYNHRRNGADAEPTPQADAPDINIGTSSMDRERWAHVVDAVIDHFTSATIAGRHLDVRENIAFQGRGEQTRFIHQHFPETGCAIAIEFKKFFMDEWTGEAFPSVVEDIRKTISELEPVLEDLLRAGR